VLALEDFKPGEDSVRWSASNGLGLKEWPRSERRSRWITMVVHRVSSRVSRDNKGGLPTQVKFH
jgi:hypothetical protein